MEIASPPIPEPPDPAGDTDSDTESGIDTAAERTERQVRVLAELSGLGMSLARHVAQAAQAALDEVAAAGSRAFRGASLALAFSRIAKAVRQTVTLEARIAEGRLAWERDRRSGAAAAGRSKRKEREPRINAGAIAEGDGNEAEPLLLDRKERLDAPEFGAAFHNRPISEIVSDICRNLGAPFDSSLWMDDEPGVPPSGGEPEAGETSVVPVAPSPHYAFTILEPPGLEPEGPEPEGRRSHDTPSPDSDRCRL